MSKRKTSSALEYAKRISRAVREGTYTPPEMTVTRQGDHLCGKIERRCPTSDDMNDSSNDAEGGGGKREDDS